MITKENVLKSTTEEDIIRFYIPDFIPTVKKNYHSPFAGKDSNPSLSFYKSKKGWKFKSHNSGEQGDIFQLVADIEKIDCKTEFSRVLETIDNKLNLGLTANDSFKIEYQSFSPLFLAYWKQFGVDQATLLKFKVRQVKSLAFTNSANKKFSFDYIKLNQVVTCYNIHERLKIYIPEIQTTFNNDLSFRGQKKAFGYKSQTSADIFGLAQLPAPPIEYVIFSAGEKDCLCANAHGFNTISLQSENQLPQEDLIKSLRDKSKVLLSCYDNDEPGKKAAEKLQKTFGINPIALPNDCKDLAIYFTKYNKADFQKLLTEAIHRKNKTDQERKEKTEGNTIFHQAEDYLMSKYNFRFNMIKHVFEFSLVDDFLYKEINENSLFVELNKSGIKISLNNLKALLKSDFCPRYNPIQYYFENLKEWNDNEPDYIAKLAGHVACEDQDAFNLHFKKWLVRAVKCSMVDGYFNKQALILVHPEHNSGKTTFMRFLCPPALGEYIAENINPEQKDSLIALATNFIINLDELKQLSRSDINIVKSWISLDKVNVRLPYESRAAVVQRVCSFVGSTNMGEFLQDETGSVRWLCFKIKSINHDYNNTITGKKEINIDDVWSQAYSLFRAGFQAELSQEEVKQNEERNAQFNQLGPEMEMLPNFIEASDSLKGEFMTSTEIHNYMQTWTVIKLNSIMVGRAMAYHKIQKVKNSKTQRYGYYVRCLKQGQGK
jgi:predicted P-loop ATPase